MLPLGDEKPEQNEIAVRAGEKCRKTFAERKLSDDKAGFDLV